MGHKERWCVPGSAEDLHNMAIRENEDRDAKAAALRAVAESTRCPRCYGSGLRENMDGPFRCNECNGVGSLPAERVRDIRESMRGDHR